MNIVKSIYHFFLKYGRVDWFSSLRLNMKLPFKQMIRMPIWVYNCKIKSIRGCIRIDSDYVKPGMIRLGLVSSGMCGNNNSLFLDVQGTVIFKGPGYMGNNSVIEVGPSAIVEFGKNFGITGSFKIASKLNIAIGNNFSCSWEVSIFDTDFHELQNVITGEIYPHAGPISIGNDVWCCQRVLILKNSCIPDRCVVAANSLVNKDFSNMERNAVIAGQPALLKKTGLTRRDFISFESNPIFDITRTLRLD